LKRKLPDKKINKKLKINVNIIILICILLFAAFIRIYFNPVDIDDAPITYRYARNIAEGNGFVYNQGERVLGTTTPLYTIILAFFNLLGVEIFFMSNLIGLLSSLVSIFLIYKILKDNKMEYVGLIAAFILAILNDFVIYTMNGMETSFYIMLILLTLYSYSRKKYYLSSFFAALTTLTRPDGLILAIVIFGHFLITKRKIPFKSAFLFVLTLLPWLIFAIIRFGSPLPQSLIGKQFQASIATIPFFLRILGFFFDRAYLILSIFFILGFLCIIKEKKLTIYATWFILYILGYILIGIDAYAWYFIPLVPIFVLFSAIGLQEIKLGLSKNRNKAVRFFGIIFPLAVCLILVPVSFLGIQHYKTKVDPNWKNYITVSQWLGENTDKNSTMMHGAIGYVGYLGKQRVIDSAFLVTKLPDNLNNDIIKQIYKRNYTAIYEYYRPDYVIYRNIDEVDKTEFPVWIGDNYYQIKNFTFKRTYIAEDLRFKISYDDYWAIYKRNDLK